MAAALLATTAALLATTTTLLATTAALLATTTTLLATTTALLAGCDSLQSVRGRGRAPPNRVPEDLDSGAKSETNHRYDENVLNEILARFVSPQALEH